MSVVDIENEVSDGLPPTRAKAAPLAAPPLASGQKPSWVAWTALGISAATAAILLLHATIGQIDAQTNVYRAKIAALDDMAVAREAILQRHGSIAEIAAATAQIADDLCKADNPACGLIAMHALDQTNGALNVEMDRQRRAIGLLVEQRLGGHPQ